MTTPLVILHYLSHLPQHLGAALHLENNLGRLRRHTVADGDVCCVGEVAANDEYRAAVAARCRGDTARGGDAAQRGCAVAKRAEVREAGAQRWRRLVL